MTDKQTIFTAIAAAVGDVKVIGKTDENKFDKYNFASIDRFLEMVNPICAKHGLFPFVDEIGEEYFTNAKGSAWVRIFYEITMYHASGEKLGPFHRKVAVPLNGAQAYGSAQSYVLKQFFRSLLMIPTGDKDDADLSATDNTIQVQPSEPQRSWAQTIIDELPADATQEQKAEAIANALCDNVKRKKTAGELANEWDRRKFLIDDLEKRFPDLHKRVEQAFEERGEAIAAPVAAQ